MPRINPCSSKVALFIALELVMLSFSAALVNHIKHAKSDKEVALLIAGMSFLLLCATAFQVSIVTVARNQARREWEEEFQAAAAARVREIQAEARRRQVQNTEEQHALTMEEELEEREEMEFIVPPSTAEMDARARARAEAEELERRINEVFGGRPRERSRERRERGIRRMSNVGGPSRGYQRAW
jgi:hypothetical protein